MLRLNFLHKHGYKTETLFAPVSLKRRYNFESSLTVIPKLGHNSGPAEIIVYYFCITKELYANYNSIKSAKKVQQADNG